MTSLDLSRQLALLMEHGVASKGQTLRLAELAQASGIRYQTLSNLLTGKVDNPRLQTLQALCQVYGISLDYFDAETEADCIRLLKQQAFDTASKLVQQINHETQALSPKGQRNVLVLLEWRKALLNPKVPSG